MTGFVSVTTQFMWKKKERKKTTHPIITSGFYFFRVDMFELKRSIFWFRILDININQQ